MIKMLLEMDQDDSYITNEHEEMIFYVKLLKALYGTLRKVVSPNKGIGLHSQTV